MSEPANGQPDAGPGGNPYVGPRAFRQGELLFGRDREVRELVSMLISDRIVLLYSPSGAGKTSLIQAQLVKALEKEDLRVLPLLRVSAAPRPEDQALMGDVNRYLLGTFLALDPDRRIPAAELAQLTLDSLLRRLETESGDDRPQVLIFDQFEEILTLDPADVETKRKFFEAVGEALRNRQRWALFSMREDYVGALEPYVGCLPSRLRTMFRLDLLAPAAASLAIREPARCRGVDFEKPAADRLIDDLRTMLVQKPDGSSEKRSGPYVEPVQLQVVCHRLWSRPRQRPDAIQADEIDPQGGDVDAALADYYAEWVRRIAQEDLVQERTIRDWFEHALLTEHGTRGQVLLMPQESQGLDNGTIQSLVKEAHLVRAEARRGSTWFELAHDRLIGPVRTSNAVWREQSLNELQRCALIWGQRGLRPEALLLHGGSLQDAETWAAGHKLTDLEREFLEASRKARDEAEKERERQHTEEELIRGRSQTRRFAWFTVIALALAAIAVGNYIEAKKEAERAGKAEKLATHQKQELEATTQQLKERIRELEVADAKLLEQREELGVSVPREEIAAAHQELQQLEEPRNLAPALRSPLRVQFFARSSPKGDRAIRMLEQRGFQVDPRDGRWTEVNAVWYGTGVDVESVRLLALTLIESGMEIHRIAPFDRAAEKPFVIHVESSAKALYQDTLTVEQVSELQLVAPQAGKGEARLPLKKSPPP
jgi:hypothetical protein